MVATTVFATEKFHATPSEAGLASGIFVVGTLMARLFSGRSIDQVGWKKMLYIGFILFLITTFLYFAVNNLGFLLVNRFLNGAALGIASTATGTIVAKIIPNERRGEGTGYYALSVVLAAAVGPFLGMFLTDHGIALLLAGGLVGLGYGTFSSSAQALSIKASPKDRMGLATSTYFIFLDAGFGIGPFLLGLFVPTIGYRGMYMGMSFVLMACFFLYFFLHGRKERKCKDTMELNETS